MPKNTENKSNSISRADSIKHLHKESVVSRSKYDQAAYYRVIDILDECCEPIVAQQSKTLVLELIGLGAKAVENCKQTIYYIPDLLPYAQMKYKESESA